MHLVAGVRPRHLGHIHNSQVQCLFFADPEASKFRQSNMEIAMKPRSLRSFLQEQGIWGQRKA
jgi:hypothetical protein